MGRPCCTNFTASPGISGYQSPAIAGEQAAFGDPLDVFPALFEVGVGPGCGRREGSGVGGEGRVAFVESAAPVGQLVDDSPGLQVFLGNIVAQMADPGGRVGRQAGDERVGEAVDVDDVHLRTGEVSEEARRGPGDGDGAVLAGVPIGGLAEPDPVVHSLLRVVGRAGESAFPPRAGVPGVFIGDAVVGGRGGARV